MAYDEDLADRVRQLLVGESDITEKKMFGGLAFLVGGNMAVAASGQGGLLVRADPTTSDKLVATTTARPMEMRGRAMQGWLRVDDADSIRTKRQLARWVGVGMTYARSLPAKSWQEPRRDVSAGGVRAISFEMRGWPAQQSWRPPPTGSMP